MGVYNYKARDKFGKPVLGVMGADSESAIAAKLKQMGYVPIVIKEAKQANEIIRFFGGLGRVSFSDLNMFTRQFFTLQRAGLAVLSSLTALAEQTTNKTLKNVIGQIKRDIEAGANLSSALEKHAQVFNALYVNMIRSAEASGRLDEMLERLSVLGEHEELIRMRVKTAMRYPVMVVAAIVIAFIILITFVVPRFSKLYSQFGTALPLPTQILLWINYAVTKFWWLLIIVTGASIFIFNKIISTKEGRFFWDKLMLKSPVFGPLLFKLFISRFLRVTATLMRSGVPILKILELSSDGVGNAFIAKTIGGIKEGVNAGKGMLIPMKESGVFPPVVIQMVAVGEETGKLDELLLHVSDYYDLQIDYTINNFTSLIEPALIFVLGIAVLFMALGIFLPMWNLMSLFKK